MEQDKNICRIDLSGNAELKDFFSRKKPGEEYKVTLTLVLTENTADGVSNKIKEIELPGDEVDGEVEEARTVTPNSDKSISVNMAGVPSKYEPMPA